MVASDYNSIRYGLVSNTDFHNEKWTTNRNCDEETSRYPKVVVSRKDPSVKLDVEAQTFKTYLVGNNNDLSVEDLGRRHLCICIQLQQGGEVTQLKLDFAVIRLHANKHAPGQTFEKLGQIRKLRNQVCLG